MSWMHVQLLFFILMSYFGYTVRSELGSACVTDRQCKVDNSHCSSGICSCKHYHAQLGNATCLESKLLGRQCIISEQCFLRVANSTCKDGNCHCSQGFVRFRKHTCLGPAKVGDVCYSDEHCQLWAKNSHCQFLIPKLFGKCVCDAKGNCSPNEPSNWPANTSISTELPRDNDTVADTFNVQEERFPMTLEDTTKDNSKPEEMSSPLVDSFLHQREHHENPLPRPHVTNGTGNPAKTMVEGTTPVSDSTATERSPERFKYRVEPNQKENEGVGAERTDVNAVSLGYSCRSDLECQKRDGGSLCLNGVCDCAVKAPNTSDSCGSTRTGCGPETFQCRDSGLCISWFFVCDGRNDCPDNSDEECEGPECPRPSFRCGTSGPCVSLAAICNGVRNCPNGEDENSCSPSDRNATQGCPDDSFRCANGQCLPKFEFCNATPKCSDGSDELPHLCSSQVNGVALEKHWREHCPFECGNGRCRSTAIVCSGRDGCGDNSDEAHCSVCRCPAIPPTN